MLFYTIQNQNINVNNQLFSILNLLLPITFVLITFIIWLKKGKNEKLEERKEYYPPNIDILDVALIYREKINTLDVSTLLINLANKGYVIIEKINIDEQLYIPEYKIIKVKEYDGNNIYEKMFFEGLVENRHKDSQVTEIFVTQNDLYNKFYMTVYSIIRDVNNSKKNDIYFEKTPKLIRNFIILMIIITFILITYKPFLDSENLVNMLLALPFTMIGFSSLFSGIVNLIFKEKNIANIIVNAFLIIWGADFGIVPFLTLIYPYLSENILYLTTYVIGLICIALLICLYFFMLKRTKKGNELYYKIIGFKNFLENLNEEDLKTLMLRDPNYFNMILPYVYIFKLFDKYSSRFTNIALETPYWYRNSDSFKVNTFIDFITHTLTRITLKKNKK